MHQKLSLQPNLINHHNIIDETSVWDELTEKLEILPAHNREILPGIKWGYYSQLFTPAYWKVQYLLHHTKDDFHINFRLGDNILEEIVACLLGGFGLKSEIGLAAFERFKNRDLIKPGISFTALRGELEKPLLINSKKVHYRFPNQKAKYIADLLSRSDLGSIPLDKDTELRNWLLTVNGVGPKTASWITRNYLNSENVAIIDIHIYRACQFMGLFPKDFEIQKDYFKLEKLYLLFCKKLGAQPSRMDALMWLQMKEYNSSNLITTNY